MKRLIKIIPVILVLALLASALACTAGVKDEKITGKEEIWGRYTVLVPSGMEFSGGNILDPNDPKTFTIKDPDSSYNYISFSMYDLDACERSVRGTKEANGADDVTLELDGAVWTGVAYKYGSSDAFQLYAEVDGEYVLVTSFGFPYDGALVKAVLGSVSIAAE